MIAHSDDSAGKVLVKEPEGIRRIVFYHEFLLKSCNHLLSLKKCVVSQIYFEITSILYLYNKLIPLFPKFSN